VKIERRRSSSAPPPARRVLTSRATVFSPLAVAPALAYAPNAQSTHASGQSAAVRPPDSRARRGGAFSLPHLAHRWWHATAGRINGDSLNAATGLGRSEIRIVEKPLTETPKALKIAPISIDIYEFERQ
jgi:hypothetical protein